MPNVRNRLGSIPEQVIEPNACGKRRYEYTSDVAPDNSMKYIVSYFILMLAGALYAQPESARPEMDAIAGQRMNAQEAGELESLVAQHPEDLTGRTKLLGHYFMARFTSAEARQKDLEQVLWIIRNRPESKIAGSPFSGIDAISDREGYNEARQMWLKQTEVHPKNATILGNAAKFCLINDRKMAENLLKEAQTIEPTNLQWPDQLGHLYSWGSNKDDATQALMEFEKAQAADPEATSKFARLDELAKSAFAAGEIEKASRYATDLLAQAQKYPHDWNYGNVIHHGNNVLGRVALKQGDVKEADQYLLKAGETPGSPQLQSFGPNMSLAKDLLEAGEKDTVLRYFELCRKFWGMGAKNLNTWADEVKAGKIPSFGANLTY